MTDAPLWFLGTLVRPRLTGADTGGRLALWEGVLPRGAAPPLHTHPQDETFYVLDGELTTWVVESERVNDRDGETGWLATHARTCERGACVHAPAGTAHTFRVESDTAHVLFVSTPAGIEDFVAALAEPAAFPWLPPPPDGPRIPADRIAAVERAHGVVLLSPPPP
jgi:quercetin dioxygenase-like cupin family protein